MKLQFFGAANEVTGSQHVISVNGKKIMLDCGMFQGRRKEAFEKNRSFGIEPSQVDLMLLSHAHIDHSGNIPNLVKHGFNGHIYTTLATVDLCQAMLRDSAYLQERDVKWVNKERSRQNKILFEPLYTIEEAEAALKNFVGVMYNKEIKPLPGLKVVFKDAGHILGSAGIFMEIEENGRKINLGFTGDIGRPNMPILNDPDILRDVDVLIMESTYGNRLHKVSGEVEEELVDTINEIYNQQGKIIIPSFAVGRTQLLVYMLHKLWNENRIPQFPIFVDSPLAIEVTNIFRLHPECFDREIHRLFLKDNIDPFGFERLKYIREVESSKALNDFKGTCIIISASGMAEAGRILHHLKNNIEDPKNLILFVGYAAEHTLARKIMNGDEEVNILGGTYKVKAKVKEMDYFSGHADQNELLEYLKLNPPNKLKHLFLVHGEPEEAIPLQTLLKKKGYKNVYYPKPQEKFEI